MLLLEDGELLWDFLKILSTLLVLMKKFKELQEQGAEL